VFLVLAHDRRRILHFNVTPHPTAQWTGQQLRNAFPFEQLPRYLLRDRDAIFGQDFRKQLPDMGIEEVLSTPRSPWQRASIERLIGSSRRECLVQVIVFNESSLRRILASYFDYYHRSRTHLSLGKVDCTIATIDEQLEYRVRAHDFLVNRSACIHCICARSSAGSQVLSANWPLEPLPCQGSHGKPPARHTEFSLGTDNDGNL
jgi:hypothetical protein